MKLIRNFSLAFLLTWMVGGCLTPPEFPVTPEITFDDISFCKSSDPLQSDAIVLSLNFKDGDGDLGLNGPDTLNEFVNKVTSFQNQTIRYKMKRLNPQLTVNGKPVPDFVSPFNCTNWIVDRDSKTNVVRDTIYVEYNPNYYNMFVDIYIDNGNNNFIKYDFSSNFKYPNCNLQGYSSRFPVLSTDLSKKSPLEGKITYKMRSLDLIVGNKRFKLQFTIQDRALNKSNEVTTQVFTLQSLPNRSCD
jgi:hypothetical protein